jgi:hypothetical protein
MTLVIGWWLAPLLVTVAAVVWFLVVAQPYGTDNDRVQTGYDAYLAIVAALVAWLVWALVT